MILSWFQLFEAFIQTCNNYLEKIWNHHIPTIQWFYVIVAPLYFLNFSTKKTQISRHFLPVWSLYTSVAIPSWRIWSFYKACRGLPACSVLSACQFHPDHGLQKGEERKNIFLMKNGIHVIRHVMRWQPDNGTKAAIYCIGCFIFAVCLYSLMQMLSSALW